MLMMNPASVEIDGVTYTMHLAVVESTALGTEDHGCFRADLCLDYNDGGGQCTPSYILDDRPGEVGTERVGSAYGHDYIMQVLKVVGVDNWEQIKGKRVYALKKDRYGYIDGIASASRPETHYMVFKTHAEKFKDVVVD
jgi:hypothetical protein